MSMEQGKVVKKRDKNLSTWFVNNPLSNTGQPIKFHLGYKVYLSIPTYLICLGVPCVFLPKNNHNLPTPDFLHSYSSVDHDLYIGNANKQMTNRRSKNTKATINIQGCIDIVELKIA